MRVGHRRVMTGKRNAMIVRDVWLLVIYSRTRNSAATELASTALELLVGPVASEHYYVCVPHLTSNLHHGIRCGLERIGCRCSPCL